MGRGGHNESQMATQLGRLCPFPPDCVPVSWCAPTHRITGGPTWTLTAGAAPDTPRTGTIGGANAIVLPQVAIIGCEAEKGRHPKYVHLFNSCGWHFCPRALGPEW